MFIKLRNDKGKKFVPRLVIKSRALLRDAQGRISFSECGTLGKTFRALHSSRWNCSCSTTTSTLVYGVGSAKWWVEGEIGGEKVKRVELAGRLSWDFFYVGVRCNCGAGWSVVGSIKKKEQRQRAVRKNIYLERQKRKDGYYTDSWCCRGKNRSNKIAVCVCVCVCITDTNRLRYELTKIDRYE